METFSFAPNSLVSETLNRENNNAITMGVWRFTSRPTSPQQLQYRVRLHGLKWYLAGDFMYDTVTIPNYTARLLEVFYEERALWKGFQWVHPYRGQGVVRSAPPVNVPAG